MLARATLTLTLTLTLAAALGCTGRRSPAACVAPGEDLAVLHTGAPPRPCDQNEPPTETPADHARVSRSEPKR